MKPACYLAVAVLVVAVHQASADIVLNGVGTSTSAASAGLDEWIADDGDGLFPLQGLPETDAVAKDATERPRADLAWLLPEAQREADFCVSPVSTHLKGVFWASVDGETQAVLGEPCWSVVVKALQWKEAIDRQSLPDEAGKLMGQLKAVFAGEGLPSELAWIAEVESSFDVEAESQAGALGLFQFMPMTAERFGLSVGEADDRTDPEKSAHAAAQYLRFLHERFGSWTLAVAAYHAGEGRVGRLLRRHAAWSLDAIAEHLPAQTQRYVSKVVATLAVREKATLSALPPPSGASRS